MKYADFFVLNHGWATRYYWHSIEENIKNNENSINLIKKRKVKFIIRSGTTPGDIIGGTPVLNLFSERFVNLLKENKIKSFKNYPVIFDSKYDITTKYYYLEFPSKFSEILLKGKSKHHIYVTDKGEMAKFGQKGLYFDLQEWDGSDIFGIKNTSLVIVTKRLKVLIERAKLKNVMFTNLEDFSFGC
ncbi:MAG: hypothetical protein AABW41_05290 [Nanoarchaeota archaeon]